MPDDNPQPGAVPAEVARWVTISEAARALGISRQAVQRRVRRGTIEAREERAGNRHRVLVRLPHLHLSPHPQLPAHPLSQRVQGATAELVARLEERVAQQDSTITRLEGEVAWLRAELERRRWPGVWPALQRFWRGEG